MARSFTRRDFLSGSLGVGAAGAFHATLGPVGPVVRLGSGARTLAIATGATSGKPHKSAKVELTLVLCTLYGGNDGLNTVVPYESSAYRRCVARSRSPTTRLCRSARPVTSRSDSTR